ncbi:MAG: glutamine-hydrolyzing GMP synthase [Bacteroidales bacterium]|nr:glutamine-hydrolyzing GMP synthase [Bacteroidales bacterium]
MDKIVILDFGSQTTQLIGRRVRELGTFCEIVPFDRFPSEAPDVIGVILSGSPLSVYAPDALLPDLSGILDHYPVLGICYGAQLISFLSGGKVGNSGSREYGRALLNYVNRDCRLFDGIDAGSQVWMSHGDSVNSLPEGFIPAASTDSVRNAAFWNPERRIWGVQFHPEVVHTADGKRLLENFVVGICGSRREWSPDSFVETKVRELQAEIGDGKVILGLSGGVDSTVAAVLLNKAVGSCLTGIFVNHGLLRKNEFEDVLADYRKLGLNVKGVDASSLFLGALKAVENPEEKRKIIGRLFIEVFEAEAAKIPGVEYLAQGTIYPDRIESRNITGKVIKSHHNVGGLPEHLNLKLCEPLKWLFKDEVRSVGLSLGIPKHMLFRHPFPGPGLAVRIPGEVTPEKVHILQDVDDIFIRSLREEGLYDGIWQAGAILLPVRTVGVMGDERTYDYAVALRAVTSSDAMTADWASLPEGFLRRLSNEIINKVRGVNRVCYDISSKPPSTIEWE